MCGRYTLKNTKEVKRLHNIDIIPNYNITPSQNILMIAQDKKQYIKWAFTPYWAKIPMNLINARLENLYIKPSYAEVKRCVIVLDGWYEWQKKKNFKIPFYHYIDSEIFYMAGIYNNNGCAIVTTEADKNIKFIHHRQPLLLGREDIEIWIRGEEKNIKMYKNKIKTYPVDIYVNNPANNDSKCIEKIRADY